MAVCILDSINLVSKDVGSHFYINLDFLDFGLIVKEIHYEFKNINNSDCEV